MDEPAGSILEEKYPLIFSGMCFILVDGSRRTRAFATRAKLDFNWLVARRGHPVEHFTKRHELRLLRQKELIAAFRQAGFETRWIDPGLTPERGLLMAYKR